MPPTCGGVTRLLDLILVVGSGSADYTLKVAGEVFGSVHQ